ncbi:unnamed protein product [Lactuca saligna]|uniref:Phytocyanin domain-containing protein n=1 Tax=Lactuca saligna TaxID=75948 RepID=A0AA35ZAF3_LACSI|nr:unnamed protein product [Lactuca saligna]
MKTTMAVFMAVFVTAFTVAVGGEVYKVGGSAGWTNIGHVDYKTWASSKTFRVGDTIVFEYNKDFHNVARVTYTDFLTCKGGASPYATFTSGNDSFPIKFPGHYYFICSIPGHCEAGQKVDIRVPVASRHSTLPSSSAPIQPLPFPYPPPSVPSLSPVKHSPDKSPSPAISHSTSPAPSKSSSLAPSKSSSAVPSKSPSTVPSQSPPPPPSQSPSPAASKSPLPAPSLPKKSPPSTPSSPSPAVAPAPAKNSATQFVGKVKLWATFMAVLFSLIAFRF